MTPTTSTYISRQNFNNEHKWNQWFAGLTDGDGSFYINTKEKSVSFELTTHITDARMLYMLKNKLKAGQVKLRSNSQSVRYRIKQKNSILDIIARLNGKLRNPARIVQFKNVCVLYNISYIDPPVFISKDDGYLAGLLDSDGSFAISVSNSSAKDSQLSGVSGRIVRLTNAKGFTQISAKVTSSFEPYLQCIQNSYGYGKVYPDSSNFKPQKKTPNNRYHWTIKSEEDFLVLYEYLKIYPLRSMKMHRMRLCLLYFKYKKFKYHLKPEGTIEAKIWAKFAKSWYKYSY